MITFRMKAWFVVMCWLCVTAVFGCSEKQAFVCSPPFEIYEGNCYNISTDKVSGDEAFARCRRMGAYLANFETLEEAMLMKQKLNGMKSGLHFYVGGRNINRRKPGGDWRWIRNGEMKEMTYFAFGSSQPDGSDSAPQDCMFFYAAERYIFHDVFCDHDSYIGGYICEK
ncbi:C-type lectin domain family 4 member M-like [Saccostrea cucullata]|uniref:C-type lectin domain family 4 member M-like n=1 Tax=Saccostrea cuccullata TaxID=36930 RepID=UPI002ED1AB63